ncbi:MAG: DUF1549 domain-containing protein, partial [Bryobacteraceae bacterium]
MPEVKSGTARNAIDNFILARLDREGLKQSPEADKRTLIRRVSFDLTGLPPTPAEVKAFLSDKSPDAYEKVVDRLLGSPHYGERMAMQWLDLARYADTHGYHIDSHRDMWPWRDWVIRAFNQNMPYDRFTIEQLAGDLLPDATRDQRVATGFNRNHMINFEGGAIPEEYQNEYVVDRVETTSVVWLGMTMGCARCHDHKYDPIRQKEFYQFYAFFNSVPEKGLDGMKGNAEPYLQLPTPEQEQRLEQINREIEAAECVLSDVEVEAAQTEWEKTLLSTVPEPPREGLQAHYEMDGNLSDSSGGYHHGLLVDGQPGFSAGPTDRAADFDGATYVRFTGGGPSDESGRFSLAFWFKPSGNQEKTILQKIDDDESRQGYEIYLDESEPIGNLQRGVHLYARLSHKWPENAIEIKTRRRLVMSGKEGFISAHQVALVYDGSGKAAGLQLYINGKREPVEIVKDSLSGTIQASAPLEIGNKTSGKPYRGQLDDLRIYSRVLTPEEIERIAVHHPARATSRTAKGTRTKPQQRMMRDYFLRYAAPERFVEAYADLNKWTASKEEMDAVIPTTMVMSRMEEPRETAVLGRGDYRNRGEVVTPGVPAALPPLPKDAPANRLTLAKWLVDPSHPLTARVAVNRYWQMYFGTGIVKTAEDFGSQGEGSVHPELLDWLAVEFMESGWDIKKMQRLIVTSATYRQASKVEPGLLEKDPENRLLARGPRFRLPAEVIRDSALMISGLLNSEI